VSPPAAAGNRGAETEQKRKNITELSASTFVEGMEETSPARGRGAETSDHKLQKETCTQDHRKSSK